MIKEYSAKIHNSSHDYKIYFNVQIRKYKNKYYKLYSTPLIILLCDSQTVNYKWEKKEKRTLDYQTIEGTKSGERYQNIINRDKNAATKEKF